MFKIILILGLGFSLLMSKEKSSLSSELEMFLFKIGFESLLTDFQIQKEQTNHNTKDIESIAKKLDYVFEEITRNNLDLDNPNSESESYKQLMKSISRLENKIENLEKGKEKAANKIIYTKFRKKENKKYILSNSKVFVNFDVLETYSKESKKSKVLRKLKRGTIINVEYCNIFSWCKIKAKKEYFSFVFVKEVGQ